MQRGAYLTVVVEPPEVRQDGKNFYKCHKYNLTELPSEGLVTLTEYDVFVQNDEEPFPRKYEPKEAFFITYSKDIASLRNTPSNAIEIVQPCRQ